MNFLCIFFFRKHPRYSRPMSLLLPITRRLVPAWKRSAHLMATSSGAHVLRATSVKMKNDFMLSLIFQFFIKIFVSYISEILKLHVFWYCKHSALCSVINLYNQLYLHKNIYTHQTLANLYISTRYRGHNQGARSVGDAAPSKWPVVQKVSKKTPVC